MGEEGGWLVLCVQKEGTVGSGRWRLEGKLDEGGSDRKKSGRMGRWEIKRGGGRWVGW